jgi:hypothetical protein
MYFSVLSAVWHNKTMLYFPSTINYCKTNDELKAHNLSGVSRVRSDNALHVFISVGYV